MRDKLIKIAQIGKTVGLKGELKLHIKSDFPEQFKKGGVFFISTDKSLTIENFSKKRSTVKFVGFNSKEDASSLTNRYLYTTKDDTYTNCNLKKDEYFWFDIIGAKVYEDSLLLGEVKSIERYEPNDYLFIKTSNELIEQGYPKEFLIPYIDRYILEFDKKNLIIKTKDTLDILKNS